MSKLIYERSDLGGLGGTRANPADWTAIIPAAGSGTRMKSETPKIIYPILGKPIVHWLIDALSPSCGRFVFVLAPGMREKVEPVIRERLAEEAFAIAIQEKPRGMADAVERARGVVRSPNSIVVWGDQVTLKSDTIQDCVRIHSSASAIRATLPTIVKRNAYIHFERGGDGQIDRVLQAREGDRMPEEGENDCGVFLFNTDALLEILTEARKKGIGIGKNTVEFNFLPLLPLFGREPGGLVTARVVSEEETLGVNTPEQAAEAEKILRARGGRKR